MLASQWTEFDFKLCTSAADIRAAYTLRLELFHEEQKFPEETEIDSYDPISAHFIVISKKDDIVTATVRLTPYPLSINPVNSFDNANTPPEQKHLQLGGLLGSVRNEQEIVNEFLRDECIGAKLSRMAVKKSYRGKGLGAMTVQEAENWLMRTLSEKKKALTMTLSSQKQAQNFYERIGYVPFGEPYDEEGMEHIMCGKEISLVTFE
ncbi:putative acetyltransferase [Pseudolycoriella hygida]|uniref:Acetyltransferase n=1 Tax=Pseudolycoriella hygida TaxID=35572 RepID=A0A9Q0S3K2_9DIPT|nr:putative acetyltransferase [Pseudolycoriella hygida]